MNHTNNTLIPDRLKSAREKLNISKAEAARRIGLTAASYVRFRSHSSKQQVSTVVHLSNRIS